MVENENKKPGLLGGKNRKNTYIPTPKPEEPYVGNATSEPDLLSVERGTIRVPLEQKCEFDALLQISEYSYSYELMAELVYEATKKQSKEENLEYQAILNNLKKKERNRLAKKRGRKNN